MIRNAATTPLPSFPPKTEIGLMTLDEFLAFKNPDEKFHSSDAYDFGLAELNRSYLHDAQHWFGDYEYKVSGGQTDSYLISDKSDALVAVLHNSTMYYNPKKINPERASESKDWIAFGVERFKQVKYLSEYAPLVYDVARKNRQKNPVLLQNIIVKGEPYQVRAEERPVEDAMTDLAILNAKGEVVAVAQNEWGATLIVTAREYRGHGFGRIIGDYWYKFNPSSTSGGFTTSGQQNAVRLWESRVREFFERGWYSELVRLKRMTPKRVAEIASGLRGKRPNLNVAPEPTPKKEVMFYADGTTLVVYDARFLSEQDEKWIYGYGFLRDAPRVGLFYFTLDYDPVFRDLITEVALQMARNEKEHLYVGEGYGDFLELDNVPNLKREGDYVWLTQDIIPLRMLAGKEKRTRTLIDPYDQVKDSLLEMADGKWS